jgi:hypothetical protein
VAFQLLPLDGINQLLIIASNLKRGDLLSMRESLFWIYRLDFFTSCETNAYHETRAIRRRLVIEHDPAKSTNRWTQRAMLQEAITLISAIAGVLAAAGSLWAARAAHRSAVTAQEATRHAEEVDRRGLLRDLSTTAHRVVAECLQIGSLIEELKTEYRMLATSSGQSGSSREKLLIQRAEAKQKEVWSLHEEARKLIEERARLHNASEEELTQSLSKLDGYLVQVLRIKDSLEREVAAAAGDNRIQREGRIKGLNQRTAKP